MPRIERMLDESKNLSRVWRYIERCSDAECRQIIGVRCSLRPDHATAMPLEAYFVAAGVKPHKAFSIIGAALTGSSLHPIDSEDGEMEQAVTVLPPVEDFVKRMSDSFSEEMDIHEEIPVDADSD